LTFIEEKHKDIIDTIDKEKKISDEIEEKLKAAIIAYKELF
jgi:F-type H+-transporting ATPase subunit alpha